MKKRKRIPLATKIYSPVEWEKRRKKAQRKRISSKYRENAMKFGLEEVMEIVKPHNDKLVAEAKLANAVRAMKKAHKIFGESPSGIMGTQEPVYRAYSILEDAIIEAGGTID